MLMFHLTSSLEINSMDELHLQTQVLYYFVISSFIQNFSSFTKWVWKLNRLTLNLSEIFKMVIWSESILLA